MRRGHYDQLVAEGGDEGAGGSGGAPSTPAVIATMEELLSAVRSSAAEQSGAAAEQSGGAAGQSGAACGYEWLPLAAQEGLVRLLAAGVLRAPGKVKPAQEHVAKGGRRPGVAPTGVGSPLREGRRRWGRSTLALPRPRPGTPHTPPRASQIGRAHV